MPRKRRNTNEVKVERFINSRMKKLKSLIKQLKKLKKEKK